MTNKEKLKSYLMADGLCCDMSPTQVGDKWCVAVNENDEGGELVDELLFDSELEAELAIMSSLQFPNTPPDHMVEAYGILMPTNELFMGIIEGNNTEGMIPFISTVEADCKYRLAEIGGGKVVKVTIVWS